LYTFDEYLLNGDFAEGSVAHESLTVASLLMLYHHSTTLRNPTRLNSSERGWRGPSRCIRVTVLLVGMFLEAEKGQGVWGGVRGLLGETTADGLGKDKDVPRRVAEVWVAGWERGRWEAEKERTRSGLAAAVENERFVFFFTTDSGGWELCSIRISRTRGSLIIRRMFLEFEIQMGELEKAKKMLYIAIGNVLSQKVGATTLSRYCIIYINLVQNCISWRLDPFVRCSVLENSMVSRIRWQSGSCA
jgi:hypothetical protein